MGIIPPLPFSRKCSKRVFAKVFYELLRFGGLSFARAGFLGRCDICQVTLQCFLQRHALGAAALDVHTSYHFILGAACPVLCVALGAEGLGVGRPARFANNCFQVPEGVLTIVAI